jgi:hypothetical protein
MNKFIKHIIYEAKFTLIEAEIGNNENMDFFKPKNIKSRKEKQEKFKKEIYSKVEIGLKRVKSAYKNEDWKSPAERMFLRLFSKLEIGQFIPDEYTISDHIIDLNFIEDDNKRVRRAYFVISYPLILSVSKINILNNFDMHKDDARNFIKEMVKKYFDLDVEDVY